MKLLALPLFLLGVSLSAQTGGDTTEYRRGDLSDTSEAVLVTADRLRSAEVSGVRSVTTISGELLDESGVSDLGDALSLSPGVFVRRYGGPGSLQTLSLRGTASGGTKILVDGLPYRSSADGGGDLSLIPLGNLREITVLRGGDGALYGSNALGGVVNIETGGAGVDGGEVRGWLGAFGERGLETSGSWSAGSQRFDLTARLSDAEGDYPFTFREFGETFETERENGGVRSFNGRLGWRREVAAGGWSPHVSFTGFSVEKGVPGGVTQGSRERLRATITEDEAMVSGGVSQTGERHHTQISSRLRLNQLRYTDPDGRFAGPDGVRNRYERVDLLAVARKAHLLRGGTTLRSALEIDHAVLTGDNLDPEVAGRVARTRLGALLHADHRFDSLPLNLSLLLDGGVRGEHYSDIGFRLSPSIGLLLKPGAAPLHFRAHLSLAYRAPTFNEQYYLNIGNVDLEVERALSSTVGVTWLPVDQLLIEGSLFQIDTRDRIVAIPRSPVTWTTLNIGRVLSRGAEIGVRGEIVPEWLTTALAYTRTETTDRSGGVTDGERIPYAPDEVASLLFLADLRAVRLNTSLTYVSHRHTLAWNTAESALPRYALLDAGLIRSVELGPVELEGSLQVTNLLDHRYEVVRSYPMPGRGWRFDLALRWGAE